MQSDPITAPSTALLLGMVYTKGNYLPPRRGQTYRDRVRCEALENSGFDVYTLDDKHDDNGDDMEKHCRTRFTNKRRMMKSIDINWGDISFDHVCLDYFFSPVKIYFCNKKHNLLFVFILTSLLILFFVWYQSGWASASWTPELFFSTLPALAAEGRLRAGATVWLPNVSCVDERLRDYMSALTKYYIIRAVENPMENPLYATTEQARGVLALCPEYYGNETQLPPLLAYSKTPFWALHLRPGMEKLDW